MVDSGYPRLEDQIAWYGLYLGRSGLYDATEEEAKKLLVERVEPLISTEHSKWVSGREQAKKARPEEAAAH